MLGLITDALAPVGQWILVIAGIGLGIVIAVRTMTWGWRLARHLIAVSIAERGMGEGSYAHYEGNRAK